jgi:transcriptional regulator with XRE-family HTH domain
MTAARLLRTARTRARLTQRALAERAGVPQPVIARIESGASRPRIDTVDRVLRACGAELTLRPRLGEGVDRTAMREMLRLTPRRRLELAASEAANLPAGR